MEIQTGTQTNIQFRRLPDRPREEQGQTHYGTLTDLKNSEAFYRPFLLGRAANVCLGWLYF